jgi:hypothetical protein
MGASVKGGREGDYQNVICVLMNKKTIMTLPQGIIALTVRRAKRFAEDKNGNRYKTKNGRLFARASVQFQETGNEWFGGFWSDALQEGSTIQVELFEEEYQGKTYKKFKIARQEDKLDDKLEMILNRLAGLQLELQIVKAAMLRKEEAVSAFEREF